MVIKDVKEKLAKLSADAEKLKFKLLNCGLTSESFNELLEEFAGVLDRINKLENQINYD